MICFISQSHCPYLNLSYENWLLDQVKPNEDILFLYKNRPSVVYGRFQNPYIECNLASMIKDQVNFVRRQSGGGCVYHDLGNLNVSFIKTKKNYNKDEHNQFLLNIFNMNRISVNERSDFIFEKDNIFYKFSGSASKEKRDRAIHHLTLLFNSDLEKLNHYITSNLSNIQSKSTPSKRSKVINLHEYITSEEFIDRIKDNVEKMHIVSEKEIIDHVATSDFYKKMISKDWIFHETPKFYYEHEYYEFEYKKGRILNFTFNESFHPSLNSQVSEMLVENDNFEDIKDIISRLDGIDYYQRDLAVIMQDLTNFLQIYLFQV